MICRNLILTVIEQQISSDDVSDLLENPLFENPLYQATLGGIHETEVKLKRNWKTGWVTYNYMKMKYENGTTMKELEIKAASTGIPGFEIPMILLDIFVATITVTKKRR